MFARRKAAIRQTVIRYGMEALHFSGAPALMRPFVQGIGAIAMLHRVQPASRAAFRPNQSLEITPDFLEQIVRRLRRSNVDLVSLDTMHERLTTGTSRRRFVCLTFDDGYRDNKRWAYPILKSLGVPFAIYVATSFPNRLGELNWVALESIVANNDTVVVKIGGTRRRLHARTLGEKQLTHRTISIWLQSRSSEAEAREIVRELASRYEVDLPAICNELCLTWDDIAELAADPLITIGAHTVNHPLLPRNAEAVVRSELRDARDALEAALHREVRHLAYPYGAAGPREFRLAAEAGYTTAVTTRPSVLFPKHRTALTSLPRIAIDGTFQCERYIDVVASGAGTALWTGLSQVAKAARGRTNFLKTPTR
jgi:peptidoglycan/xylan/chitin deacetylase (PgdA/CDA1 family)